MELEPDGEAVFGQRWGGKAMDEVLSEVTKEHPGAIVIPGI